MALGHRGSRGCTLLIVLLLPGSLGAQQVTRHIPTAWVSAQSPPFLVLVAESERFFPSILEEAARFVRLMREAGRSADLQILAGRRHVTTTTRFADPQDRVANLVAEFVRDPKAVTGTA